MPTSSRSCLRYRQNAAFAMFTCGALLAFIGMSRWCHAENLFRVLMGSTSLHTLLTDEWIVAGAFQAIGLPLMIISVAWREFQD